MKIINVTSICISLLIGSDAFSVAPSKPIRGKSVFFSAVEDGPTVDTAAAVSEAKSKLLMISQNLQKENGLFIVEKKAKMALEKAVKDLEDAVELSSPEGQSWKPLGWPACLSAYEGDWTLVCTTATNTQGVDISAAPGFLKDPLERIRTSVLDVSNKYLKVQQKIKSTKNDGVIDRVDHTLELEPPKQLRDVLDNLPEQLSTLNINPLSVSKSKLVLIHKATVDSESTKTKLTLQSIVLNVAGESRVLDPNGQDVLGLNIPSLGEFMNTADFTTTYIDKNLRISRGKLGRIEQLRVFTRTEPSTRKINIESDFSDEEEIVDIESSIADVDKDSIGSPSDEEDSSPSDVEDSDVSP